MSVDSRGFDSTREMLSRERATLLARMQALSEDTLHLEIDSDGVPPSGFERESAIISMLYGRLGEIDGALARLDDGTYGVCADCSNEIPPRRLEALPFATLCVQCQSMADKRVKRHA